MAWRKFCVLRCFWLLDQVDEDILPLTVGDDDADTCL
jgi:hypothetical protein